MKKSLTAVLAAAALASLLTTTPALAADNTTGKPSLGLNSATKAERMFAAAAIRDNAIANAKAVYSAAMSAAANSYQKKAATTKIVSGRPVKTDLAPALRARKAEEAAAANAYRIAVTAAKDTYTRNVAAINAGK